MGTFSGTVHLAAPRRLDRYIAEDLRLLRRSQLKPRRLAALVNGKAAKFSRAVKEGDYISLEWRDEPPSLLLPENIPLDILYEDSRVVVINKAQGLVVHPGAGNREHTLVNALLYHKGFPELCASGGAESLRPFIVHRLDKDTSGVLIAAWDADAHFFLSEEFRARRVHKRYAALVDGRPPAESGIITANIARDRNDRKRFAVCESDRGKQALTRYRVVRDYGEAALLALRPKTGRTHQLRVHLTSIGCPIIGDPLYGKKQNAKRSALRSTRRSAPPTLMLHAASLRIALESGEPPHTFHAPLPQRFREFIARCHVPRSTR